METDSRVVQLGGQPTIVANTALYRDFWDSVDAGEWEINTLNAIEAILAPGDIYIDIGAWIGPTVLHAARIASSVIAYEPDPVAADELRLNLQLNKLTNVEVRQLALFDRNGVMPFGGGSHKNLGESVSSLVYGQHCIEVPVRDAFEESKSDVFRACKLIKIDVEGAEYRLIPRLGEYIRDVRPALLLSVHSYALMKKYNIPVRLIRGVLRIIRSLGSRLGLLLYIGSYDHIYHVRQGDYYNTERWREISWLALFATLLRFYQSDELLLCNFDVRIDSV